MAAAGAAAAFRSVKAADGKSEIHAVLLHPGRNMWGDWKMPDEVEETDGRKYVPDHIRFDEAWSCWISASSCSSRAIPSWP